ncbi:MAG: lysophospholipid acyltransferase family protein [Dehalococcoidia bacterium]|nr:lysophospholipid acyltransferase family protein [Dehalococcoidia bacterium]
MLSRLFFAISKFAVRSFFFLTTRWHITGRGNIPRTGPVIVVSNHMTFAEPCIVCLTMKRETKFATKEGFFRHPFIRWGMTSYGTFPVYQGKADRATLRKMEDYLKQGLALAIFPEGTRSQNASLIPALNGAALMAHRTGALLMPVGIYGTEKMRGTGWFLKRPVIHIHYGKPFDLPRSKGKQDRDADTRLIMSRIAELLPPGYRGAYGDNK